MISSTWAASLGQDFNKVLDLTIADFVQALPSGKTPKGAFQNVLNKSIPNNATAEYLSNYH